MERRLGILRKNDGRKLVFRVMTICCLMLAAIVPGRTMTFAEDMPEEVQAETEEWSEQEPVQESDHSALTDGTYSILLVGSDTRTGNEYGNSDAMILLTINHNKQAIYMVSFMRDLYADIPGYGVQKLNAAYAIGGGDLLSETLESNYQVYPDCYAEIEFESMADLIDIFGGIDLEVSAAEVEVANSYIEVMCQEQNKNYGDYCIYGEGYMHLNGLQAVGYARNRYVGNSDYERTSRQRKVVSLLLEKVRGMDISELTQICVMILPKIHTNLQLADLIALAAMFPAAKDYEMAADRIPYDGMYTVNGEILTPYMEETIQMLHNEIYGG